MPAINFKVIKYLGSFLCYAIKLQKFIICYLSLDYNIFTIYLAVKYS
jgi:hypothetical protein